MNEPAAEQELLDVITEHKYYPDRPAPCFGADFSHPPMTAFSSFVILALDVSSNKNMSPPVSMNPVVVADIHEIDCTNAARVEHLIYRYP